MEIYGKKEEPFWREKVHKNKTGEGFFLCFCSKLTGLC